MKNPINWILDNQLLKKITFSIFALPFLLVLLSWWSIAYWFCWSNCARWSLLQLQSHSPTLPLQLFNPPPRRHFHWRKKGERNFQIWSDALKIAAEEVSPLLLLLLFLLLLLLLRLLLLSCGRGKGGASACCSWWNSWSVSTRIFVCKKKKVEASRRLFVAQFSN